MAKGFLNVNVYVDNLAQPLKDAQVKITGENADISLLTDLNGKTEVISLDTIDKKYTESYQTDIRPYLVYTVTITYPGFNTTVINNVPILDGETSIQNVFLNSKLSKAVIRDVTEIEDISVWSNYSASNNNLESGAKANPKVLSKIVLPEYIVVHDGIPTDTNAPNYNIAFVDYVKNVACSEIYSTWPIETLKANIYCIISFALNRIYTEWYKSKKYNFSITSSPIYDQKYSHNRTIFSSISNVVDEVLQLYLRKNDRSEPFLALYNDGVNSNKDGWFSQWGSKDLGDKGFSASEIVKYYYGDSILIEKADPVPGLPTSYPGFPLKVDSCGSYVKDCQNQLNYISGSYPLIPKIINPNGNFDLGTKNTVEVFQNVFNLPVTGIIDYSTWYKISYIYVAVSNMIEGINI